MYIVVLLALRGGLAAGSYLYCVSLVYIIVILLAFRGGLAVKESPSPPVLPGYCLLVERRRRGRMNLPCGAGRGGGRGGSGLVWGGWGACLNQPVKHFKTASKKEVVRNRIGYNNIVVLLYIYIHSCHPPFFPGLSLFVCWIFRLVAVFFLLSWFIVIKILDVNALSLLACTI
jgi:hypothetical protein